MSDDQDWPATQSQARRILIGTTIFSAAVSLMLLTEFSSPTLTVVALVLAVTAFLITWLAGGQRLGAPTSPTTVAIAADRAGWPVTPTAVIYLVVNYGSAVVGAWFLVRVITA